MEVTDAQGNPQLWAVEMLGVNSLVRSGMSPKTVKPGDKLTVTGFGARNGTNTANASSVNRTDTGESLWASVQPGGN
jgi:protein involved in polysaccharide export with SLBB domain